MFETPNAPINRPNRPGVGTMCGRSVSWSATTPMSNHRAPGMRACTYSAAPSLFSVGR